MTVWKKILRIGCTSKLQGPERHSVVIINGLSFALFIISSILFVHSLAGQPYISLYWLLPIILYAAVLYLNHKEMHQRSRAIFFSGSLVIITVLCFTSKGIGGEYGLVVLGITSALIFKRNKVVYLAWLSTVAVLIVCKVSEQTKAVVTKSVNDLDSQLILGACVLLVFLQILIFRSQAYRYYKKLNRKYLEVHTALDLQKKTEAELKVANEELLAANEALNNLTDQLDWMVRQKNIELQSYLDAINVHLYSAVTDLNGKIVRVNEPLLKVAGYNREELLGGNFRILNSDYHPAEFYQDLYKCILSGNIWRGEIRNKAKDGSHFWIDQIILPVKDESARLKYFLMIALPITERKRMEEERVRTMRMLESIAHKASHELRAPLARILGLTHLLSRDMIKADEFNQITHQIVLSSRELDEATRELTLFVNGHHQLFDGALPQEKVRTIT